MKQLTEKEAIAFADSKVYESWTPEQIVRLQLFQDRLCVPFSVYHKAITEVLGRPVYTHEFTLSNHDSMILEYLGEKPTPTFDEIINLIPEEKRIIIGQ